MVSTLHNKITVVFYLNIMVKNIIIVILAFIVIVEGAIRISHKFTTQQAIMPQTAQKSNLPPAGPNARGRGAPPILLGKGMNLKTTPLFKYAYQIAPGDLSSNAKQALIGWNITSQSQSDKSTLVTLTPKDSEDQNLQYIIKQGQVLYFIEQTPVDDKVDKDTDLNYRDDYGVITDQSGVIQ